MRKRPRIPSSPLPPTPPPPPPTPQNEHKEVKVDDILGAEEAKKIVKDALNMYQESYVPKKLRSLWA
jgi:hypothetical protein